MNESYPKVQLYIASSLDGFIAASDGSVEWLNDYMADELRYDEFYAEVGSLVMGRTTYEQVCGFGEWAFTGKQTIVLTHNPQPPEPVHSDVSFYGGDLTALCAVLKDAAAGNIWLMGGGEVVRSFLQEDLIDEILLFVMPLLLGAGIPLFLDTGKPLKFSCKNAERFGNGVVLLHYGKL